MPAALTEPQADALRELTNVAAGHAARALSTLLGVEKFGLWPAAGAARRRAPAHRAARWTRDAAHLGRRRAPRRRGRRWRWILTEPHVQTLTSAPAGAAGQRFQTPEVALRDAANLVYSAALVAVMRLCGVRALHSVPVVGEGPAELIARMCVPEQRGWVLEAEVYASPLSGRFLLLPDSSGTRRRSSVA